MPRSALPLLLIILVAACRPPSPDDETGPDAAPTTADATPGADAAPATSCAAIFTLEGHGAAGQVLVTGSFTDWAGSAADGAIAMTLAAGTWTVEIDLEPGSHPYKFIVDGTWITDPGNPNTADDGFGGVNSVRVCD